MKFDLQALEALPIQDVIIALGGKFKDDREPTMSQYNMNCCDSTRHKSGDKHPSMTIWTNMNICKCHVCGVAGNSIAVAKKMHKDDFKAACEWLHYTFNIPMLEDDRVPSQKKAPKKFSRPVKKQTYQRFNPEKGFKHIDIKPYIGQYKTLKEEQALKLVYTFIYRYSLTTDRVNLHEYYTSRGIESTHLSKIGFLSGNDVVQLVKQLKKLFEEEVLSKFGIINDAEKKYGAGLWKQVIEAAVVPSFDVHSDMVTGMMLRPIDKTSNKWFSGKESRLSVPAILKPLPFGVGYKLLSSDCDIYITEGHIDALSLPSAYCFIASPGVQAFEPEQLGLLQNRNIKLIFDQDEAGQMAAWGHVSIVLEDSEILLMKKDGYKEELEKMTEGLKLQGITFSLREIEGFRDKLLQAGAKTVHVVTWDTKLGKDVNDLLINGNLEQVFK